MKHIFLICLTILCLAASAGCSRESQVSTDKSTHTNVDNGSTEVFQSGEDIQVTWGKGAISCTISYTSHHTALTAGHCGKKGAKVFSKNKEIGWISNNYLFDNTGIDIAEITLFNSPGYEFKFDIPVRQPLQSGMPLSVFTALNGSSEGTLQNEVVGCQTFSIDDVSVGASVYSTELHTSPGSSGAPVYSKENQLIGIVQGGSGKGITTVTPLLFLEPQDTLIGMEIDLSKCSL